MKRIVALVLLPFLLRAVGSGQATTKDTTKEGSPIAPAIDIYEAVLRYQIKNWELAADSYCIEVNGKDANATLLSRLSPLPVKRASACRKKTVQKVMMQVVSRKSGKMSVIFDMEEIHWRTNSEAEVGGGYLCGGLCMAGGTYHVSWDGTRWTVTEYDIHVQS